MTDKEIMEMLIQVHRCINEIFMALHHQPNMLNEQITKLELLINQIANRTSLPSIESELTSNTTI